MIIEQTKTIGCIKPTKWVPAEMPHATIETNRTCNMRCKSCYNLDKTYVKTLSQVKQEIDLMLEMRRLQAITLLGGEPTLHKELFAIIRYVKSKGLVCQILTNGLVLLDDADGSFLEGLAESGVDKVLLHLDEGQRHVHADLDKTREILFDKLERIGIHFSLALTVYNEYQGIIPGLVERYARYTCFDGVLALLARDPKPPFVQKARMEDEVASIVAGLEMTPSFYIPTNRDDRQVGWVKYFYFINSRTGRAFALSPRADRVFRRLYRWLKGRHLFVLRLGAFSVVALLLLAGLTEVLTRPSRLRQFLRLLRGSGFLGRIKFGYIVIQNPPDYNRDRRELTMCYQCPDATIRNGRLVPACIADQLSPLPGSDTDQGVDPGLAEAVYRHMGA
jgi:hypothetical protein